MSKRNVIFILLSLCFAHTSYCMEEEEESSTDKDAWMYETSRTQTQDLYEQLYEQLREKNITLQKRINKQQQELARNQYIVDGALYLYRQLGAGIDQETYEKMCTHIADIQYENTNLKNQNFGLYHEYSTLNFKYQCEKNKVIRLAQAFNEEISEKNKIIKAQGEFIMEKVIETLQLQSNLDTKKNEIVEKHRIINNQESTILELQRNPNKKKNEQIKTLTLRYNELLQNYIHSQNLLEKFQENEFKYQQELKSKQQEIAFLKTVSSKNEQKLSKYKNQIAHQYINE